MSIDLDPMDQDSQTTPRSHLNQFQVWFRLVSGPGASVLRGEGGTSRMIRGQTRSNEEKSDLHGGADNKRLDLYLI